MHAPLFLYHATFLIDGAVVKIEFIGEVLEHQEYRVKQLGAVSRHIRNLKARVVKSC